MSCDAIYQVPGPAGAAGADGADGADGIDAYTETSAAFTMPAAAASVSVSVDDNSWMSPTSGGTNGQVVHVQNAGYMLVASKTGTTTVSLTNLGYTGNAVAGTVIPIDSRVSPGGIKGTDGASGSSGAPSDAAYITRQANASLTGAYSLGTLTTGLLKHTVAAAVSTPLTAIDGTDYLSPTTGLEPADIGVTVQPYDAFLTNIAALGTAADRLLYTTGVNTIAESALTAFARTLLDDATAAAARTTLGVVSGYGILGSASSVDCNSATTDNSITMGSARYIIDKVTVDNASISLTTATAGVFTAVGGGGTTIAADQALSALTASTKFDDLTLQAITGTDVFTSGTLYFRIGTAQGAAATADVRIFGWKLD
jgi:hypothetical protein